ncbi:MAG: fibronectin type III domain-containing protein [Oscillospiraceae bacterium]|nr:fibronectin type III domain-containing protein [Oscillospiraceae bacterium]
MNKKFIAGLIAFSLLFSISVKSATSVFASEIDTTTTSTDVVEIEPVTTSVDEVTNDTTEKVVHDPVVNTGYALPTSTSASIIINSFRYFDSHDSVGIMYSTDSNVLDNVITKEVNSYFGYFSGILKDLEPSTTYYYRAYVNTSDGQVLGEIKSFTTLKPSNVTTGDAVSVTSTSATIQDNSYKNIIIPLKSGIGYSTKSTDSAENKISGYKPSKFSIKLTKLQPNTTYYYYTYVYNIYGNCFKGEIKSFTTLP